MKRLTVLGMLALLLVLSVSAARAEGVTPSAPSLPVAFAPAATGTIAYVIPDDKTGDQIWLMEPDGSNQRKIYSTGRADPSAVDDIGSLSWRPDAGELVFASNHEKYCSWYASDVYAIFPDGSGYRRVTNAPDCAALAKYPQGSVTVSTALATSFYQIYVAGAPDLKTPSLGTVTFDHVADLGSAQAVVAIQGKYRWFGDPVHVTANQNVSHSTAFYGQGLDTIGAWGPTWRSDGSRIGYTFGCAALYSIADQPPVNTQGEQLFISDQVMPCAMAWGPTPATASDIVYYTSVGGPAIYRTKEHSTNPGEKLTDVEAVLLALHYLPDGSGVVFTSTNAWGDSANIYRYDFQSGAVTALTEYTDKFARDFAISPDGQKIVFELAPQDWSSLWGGASDLWMMNMDGSNAHLLKSRGAHPSWSLRAPYLPPPSTTQPGSKLYLPLLVR